MTLNLMTSAYAIKLRTSETDEAKFAAKVQAKYNASKNELLQIERNAKKALIDLECEVAILKLDFEQNQSIVINTANELQAKLVNISSFDSPMQAVGALMTTKTEIERQSKTVTERENTFNKKLAELEAAIVAQKEAAAFAAKWHFEAFGEALLPDFFSAE